MQIGVSKIDITPNIYGSSMLGYGIPDHKIEGSTTPIYARAFYIESKNQSIAIVVAEIAFFTPILRIKILDYLKENYSELNLNDNNVLLCAQHTHSAPGGYSYHPFYNITTPGLKKEVLNCYTSKIATAIYDAYQNKQKGIVKIGKSEIEPDKKVSFNRSIEAYNSNPEVELITQETSHLGVNREMTLLKFESSTGKALGSINWFAVHPTSIPNTLRKIHADNKGYAARYLENEHLNDNPDYVGAFAQGNAGDVTPNFNYDKTKKYNRYWNGPYIDHDRNALYNGRLQFEKAIEIEQDLENSPDVGETVDGYTIWQNMSQMNIDPMFANGKIGAITSPSCLGVAMFIGTQTEGLGFPDFIIPVAKTLSKGIKTYEQGILPLVAKTERNRLRRKYKAQGVKDILMETGENRLFGTKDIKNFVLPDLSDKTVELIKHFDKKGAYDHMPMTPQILPFQVIRIGNVAIVAIAFEITTIAGRRLQSMLEKELLSKDIHHVILCPYSNAYNGYVTTQEEYQIQLYEGGHTVFGQWTLGAVQQICFNMVNEFKKSPEDRNITSDVINFPNEEELKSLVY
ncbi:MAG: neutral/alkaline non-lysosomal ceramidase N-terminal domain-containing protein [Chitinophagales bacterium]